MNYEVGISQIAPFVLNVGKDCSFKGLTCMFWSITYSKGVFLGFFNKEFLLLFIFYFFFGFSNTGIEIAHWFTLIN